MKTSIYLSLFILLMPIDTYLHAQSNEITTFILVRHAEKADDIQDPDLSPEGVERSELLTRMLAEIEFDAIYSTPYIRTIETVRMIAEQSQINITEYQPDDPMRVASELIDKHRGKHVLIAGHSNTVPQLANALLGRKEISGDFDESDYENILIVTISSDGGSNLLHLKY